MKPDVSQAWLYSTAKGEAVSAQLWDGITPKQIRDWSAQWTAGIAEGMCRLLQAQVPREKWPKSLYWNWRQKSQAFNPLISKAGFSVMCENQTQGMMFVDLAQHRCKLKEQAGKHLVYVDFVETAPWNREEFLAEPRYHGVGTLLMRAAIKRSRDEEFGGRIGLHSLPESEEFYRRVCGMTDLGTDSKQESYLRYFEMTPDQADAFIKKGDSA